MFLQIRIFSVERWEGNILAQQIALGPPRGNLLVVLLSAPNIMGIQEPPELPCNELGPRPLYPHPVFPVQEHGEAQHWGFMAEQTWLKNHFVMEKCSKRHFCWTSPFTTTSVAQRVLHVQWVICTMENWFIWFFNTFEIFWLIFSMLRLYAELEFLYFYAGILVDFVHMWKYKMK